MKNIYIYDIFNIYIYICYVIYRRLRACATGKSFRFVRACERAKLRVPARRCCFQWVGFGMAWRAHGRAARALPLGAECVWETIF